MAEQRGRCLICYAPGPPARKTGFVCGACGDPKRIVVVCECGDRNVYGVEDADILAVHFEQPTDLKAGTILKLPHCSKCLKGSMREPFRIEHYEIAD